MAGLHSNSLPVASSLHADKRNQHLVATRRRRLSSASAQHKGRRHGPVHSLNALDRRIILDRLAAAADADFYNKQTLAPTTTSLEALTSPDEADSATFLDNNHSLTTVTASAGQVPRVHSLDMNRTAMHHIDMSVPNSPPDLSSSKSSKSSSSFRSSILSDAAGEDISTHFEDISLADTKRDSYDLNAHKDAHPRPIARALHSAAGAKRKHKPTVETMRSYHMAQLRPGQMGRPVLDDKCTNMPASRQMRPGFRNSINGSNSAPKSPTRFGTSRSPSPTKPLVNGNLQRSATSIPGNTTNNFLNAHPPRGPARRRTWAPGRKTVKQLEDEYHDSDEEVPEDAIIWNVPVSPLEPFTAASRDPSPRRQSSQSSLSSAGRSASLDKYPSAPTTAVTVHSNSSTPHLLTLPRSATTGSFSDPLSDLLSLRERHKSWNNDLSDEARQIAAALEVHNTSRRQSTDTRNSFSTPLTSPPGFGASRRQSSSSTISLPPIQKSNVMIDPLPSSKEKEAVLSRTRPSWLPPKCQKEERKHLKEWERMMAQSAVADRRRATKKLSEMEERKYSETSLERIWEEDVLANWEDSIRDPRTRELWWRGINPKVRGQVWKRAIGNALQLTPASYAAALKRAADSFSSEQTRAVEEVASSAFPETGLFAPSAPMHGALIDVLRTHVSYRPEIATSRGVARVAALLLMQLGTAEDAFIALANVLSRPLPQAYLTGDRAGVERFTSLVLSTLKVKLPALHEHFLSAKVRATPSGEEKEKETIDSPVANDFSPLSRTTSGNLTVPRPSSKGGRRALPAEAFIAPMMEGLFTAHLDLEALTRLWDVYVFEGDKALVRAYVGVCSLVESRLYGDREEVLAVLGEGAGRVEVSVEEIVDAVREAGKVGPSKRRVS